MKRGVILVLELILIIFFINQISASTVGNPSNSITRSYSSGEAITGWVNISLTNEPTNSILKSSFGETISLIDLISKSSNSGFVKSCNPSLCESNYLASNGNSEKILDLNESGSVLVGLKILSADPVTSISKFQLNISSNNSETEKFPLSVDILNDGVQEWNAYVPSNNFGSENYGCFQSVSGEMFVAGISTIPYCEKIRLSKTPQAEIGARITWVSGAKDINFDLSIQKADGGLKKTCPSITATGSGPHEKISCVPDGFSVNEPGDYFVCISTPTDTLNYNIIYEQNNPVCGFSGYSDVYNRDFEIFARPKMYAPAINFSLNNDELAKAGIVRTQTLEKEIENYITSTYNKDCSSGCVIPIKIFSGVSQQLNITNITLSYFAGVLDINYSIYDVQETPALINSEFQKLYLGEAGFYAPAEAGNHTFSVELNGNSLFSEQINVGETAMIKSLSPQRTGVKYPTKFKVILNDSSANITSYTWDFGDGQTQSTTIGSVSHTYNSIGNYILKINLLSKTGSSSKEFNITVVPASEIVSTLLGEAEINIAQIKSQITTFTAFEQKALNYSLKPNQLESNITRLKTAVSEASSEAQFEAILGELLEMNIPNAVAKTTYSEGIVFYPDGNNIDLNILRQIGGGNYETNKESQYKEAVLAWDEANANTEMIYSEISAIYPDYEEPFLKTFDVTVTKTSGEDAYLIIKDMKNLFFNGDYSQKKEGGYYYITLNQAEKNIVFSTTENVDFVNLPMFVSPAISQLTLAEWTPYTKEGGLKRWILFSIIAALILLAALAIWIILQFWYKRKYENYLFKNRNNLYNLINYIQNEKNKGTNERDIAGKLRKAGWSSEQLRYALRKHAGKSTGMPEIPIGKILKDKKTDNAKK